MSAPCFLASEGSLGTPAAPARFLELSGAEGHHAVSVKRIRVGEQVLISDGRGQVATGQVNSIRSRPAAVGVGIEVVRRIPPPSPRLTVALSLLKGERLDRAIEQLTEVGADRIIPLATARSVVRWRPDQRAAAVSKLEVRAREASKQSRRAWIPEVSAVLDFPELVSQIRQSDPAGPVVLLDVAGGDVGSVMGQGASVADILMLVGPEGGFAPAELAALKAAGVSSLGLGGQIMRSGTAAVAGTVALSLVSGRWQTGSL